MMINKNLSSANQKYKCNAYGISYPDHNTDLLCFNMMVIDTIANYKVSMLSLEDYYDYIGYLSTIGFEKEIIDAFVAIYTNKNNINVSNYFEQIIKYRCNFYLLALLLTCVHVHNILYKHEALL